MDSLEGFWFLFQPENKLMQHVLMKHASFSVLAGMRSSYVEDPVESRRKHSRSTKRKIRICTDYCRCIMFLVVMCVFSYWGLRK